MQCHDIRAEAHDHLALVGHSLQAPQRHLLCVAADVRHFQQERRNDHGLISLAASDEPYEN